MAWTTPKTDWKETYTPTGAYAGDWFGVEDYLRIKGNLEYLNDQATIIFGLSQTFPTIPTVTYTDFAYASTIDVLERALEDLTTGTRFNPGIPATKTWRGNDIGPRSSDLNRIESACLKLNDLMTAALSIRVKLAFQMGGSKF